MTTELEARGDGTDAATAVEDLRQALEPFVVATQATRMPMIFTDAKTSGNPIRFANDSFLSLTGYEREAVIGRRFAELLHSGLDVEAIAQLDGAMRGTLEGDPEIHYVDADGAEFWASVLVSPVRDKSGAVVQHFISFIDLTAHRREQAHLALLIDELNHRVKNTLSTVQAIVSQTLRKTSDASIVRETIEARLFALSRSHDLLTAAAWRGASLRDVVTQALEPFGIASDRAERIVLDGAPVRLSPKATLAFGTALHELATNAVRYGAFAGSAGSIRISWHSGTTADRRLVLRWEERGGPPVTPPSRTGFGWQVVGRELQHELDGKVSLDYRPEGLVVTIDIPAPPDSRER